MNPHLATLALLTAAVLNLQPFFWKLLGFAGSHKANPLAAVALLLFTIFHGRIRLGGRQFGWFMGITFVVTFLMETLSIESGLVGDYEYSDALGPKIGNVPVLIPGAWLMMLYPTLLTVETILDAPPIRVIRDKFGAGRAVVWCVCVSFLTAVAMTAWDVGVETIIAITGEYTWKVKGAYFGIPIANFVSWVGTSFAACFAFLLLEMRSNPRNPPTAQAPAWQPVAAYLVVFLVTFFGNLAYGNFAPTLITFFVMTPYLLLAGAKLWQKHFCKTA